MCTREMTLGEEIINLTKKGVDVPTVERMYRSTSILMKRENQRLPMQSIWNHCLILEIQFAIVELMLRQL